MKLINVTALAGSVAVASATLYADGGYYNYSEAPVECMEQWSYKDEGKVVTQVEGCQSVEDFPPFSDDSAIPVSQDGTDTDKWCFVVGGGDGTGNPAQYSPENAVKQKKWGYCFDDAAVVTNAPTGAPTSAQQNVTGAPTRAPTSTQQNVTDAPTGAPTSTQQDVTGAPTGAPTTSPIQSDIPSTPTSSPTASPTSTAVNSAPSVVLAAFATLFALLQF